MNNKGLSLLETVIAVLIVTIVAGGVFSTLVGSKVIFNRARHRLQAFNFAREFQDRLRSNYGYTDVENNEIEPVIDRGELSDLEGTITYDVSEPEHGGYKIVNVRVGWSEPEL